MSHCVIPLVDGRGRGATPRDKGVLPARPDAITLDPPFAVVAMGQMNSFALFCNPAGSDPALYRAVEP